MTLVSFSDLITHAQAGKVVSFPTDTVPALAVLPDNAEQIFVTKKRSPDKPLILMGNCLDDLWEYIIGTETQKQTWKSIAERYLPGALTLVLPASERVSPQMNPQDTKTIGVRIPNLELARSILAQTGPLATTSANLSGNPPLETMESINQCFPDVFTLNNYPQKILGSGQPSTVVKWTETSWEILRQGSVIFHE